MTISKLCKSSGFSSLLSGPSFTRSFISKVPLLLSPGLAFYAADALGCASCTGAIPEPVREAYNYSTAWLSFVPLIFMGSVIYSIYRAVKRGQSNE